MATNDEKLERAKKIFELANADFVDEKSLAKRFASLLATLKDLKQELLDAVDNHKGETTSAIQSLLTQLSEKERALSAQLAQLAPRADIDALASQLRAEIGNVQALIPTIPEPPAPIDLTPYDEKFKAVEGALEALRMAEDTRNRLEVLEGPERLKTSAIDELDDFIDWVKKEFKKVVYVGSGPMSVSHWPIHETFTMNGSDTTVTLQQAPAAQGTAIFGARYNGQVLDLSTHYTINGNKVSFVGFTPEADTIFSITYQP